jgi:hypothetical protein
MSLAEMHVLERKSQPVRGAARVAPLLRAEMEDHSVSAKELAMQMRAWAAEDPRNRWAPDYRTIQHAMLGSACALDTYLALAGFFGWDFTESVQSPIHGADPLSAREAEVVRQLTQVAALQARVERDRALRAQAAPRMDRLARRPSQNGTWPIGGQGTGAEQALEELGPANLDLFDTETAAAPQGD